MRTVADKRIHHGHHVAAQTAVYVASAGKSCITRGNGVPTTAVNLLAGGVGDGQCCLGARCDQSRSMALVGVYLTDSVNLLRLCCRAATRTCGSVILDRAGV